MDSATRLAPPMVTAPPRTATRAERRRVGRPVRGWAMPAVVALATLVLRLATAARGPTDWDSAQYAAAVGHFDVTHGQPQPPGYWLYVLSGRVVHQVSGVGVIHSLVLVAALASAAAAGLTAVAGRDLGGRWVGWAAGAVVATSPFAWFAGSIVATYSFDMLAGALFIILAWRARPGSWHGLAAAASLGLLAGFRQSVVQSFALLALVAVVGSTRRWSRLVATAAAGAVGLAVWMVPMALAQPGGIGAWAHATRVESAGAARATSVFDPGAAGGTNIGTFAGYTVVALAPLALLALLAGVALGLRRLLGRPVPTGADGEGEPTTTDPGPPEPPRPWYQSRTAVLAAAIVPPVALVVLVQFAKGGYLLAYLPAAVIALLLPLGALVRRRPPGVGWSPGWLAVATLGVVVVVALGAQRFLGGGGVLPERWVTSSGRLWLTQPRYQAPYADTRQAIREADAVDAGLQSLGPSIQPGRDVVVFDTLDGGPNIYRNAGWSLPAARVALVAPDAVVYNQQHGSLDYASGATIAVGRSGSAFLVASPALPGLASLTAQGYALPVATPRPIGGFRVWRILPGAEVLGVRVVTRAGPRPLGRGI